MPETPIYTKKAWTVLIFMAADNDLAEKAKYSRRRMKKINDDTHVHVVGQIHTRPRFGSGVERFRVTAGNIETLDDSMPDLNTGNPTTLRDFLIWGCQHFPAERTALIIWGHGTGLEDLPPDFDYSSIRESSEQAKKELKRTLFSSTLARLAELNPIRERGIAVDATARDYLDTKELEAALTSGLPCSRKLDLLGFDACLMGTIEIAYQLRRVADIMVSSQDPVPGQSWPYEEILNALANQPEMSSTELGAVIVEKYGIQVAQDRESYSLAALDLSRVDEIYASTATLVEVLEPLGLLTNPAIKKALYAATASDLTRPSARDVVDFQSWCTELRYQSRIIQDTLLHRTLVSLEEYLAPRASLVRACYSNRVTDNQIHGISIYWPREIFSTSYTTLDWSSSGWDRLVSQMLKQN